MPFLGERHQNIFMVSWTCRRALLNWPTLRSGGVFRLRGATAISQQARAAEGLLGKMSSRSILEGELLWQDLAVMHPPGRSPMAKCSRNAFPRRPTVARYRCGVFSGCRPWQVFRCDAFSGGGGVQSWRDYAAMRFRAAIRGSFFASCVPEGASDGKSAPSWQHIAAMHPKRAGFGKIFAPCIRKAPQTAV